MAWRRRLKADLSLRLAGLALLGCAAAAILCLRRIAPVAPDRLAAGLWLLGLAAFVATSAGAAMLTLGGHLLDPVELSDRWTRSR